MTLDDIAQMDVYQSKIGGAINGVIAKESKPERIASKVSNYTTLYDWLTQAGTYISGAVASFAVPLSSVTAPVLAVAGGGFATYFLYKGYHALTGRTQPASYHSQTILAPA